MTDGSRRRAPRLGVAVACIGLVVGCGRGVGGQADAVAADGDPALGDLDFGAVVPGAPTADGTFVMPLTAALRLTDVEPGHAEVGGARRAAVTLPAGAHRAATVQLPADAPVLRMAVALLGDWQPGCAGAVTVRVTARSPDDTGRGDGGASAEPVVEQSLVAGEGHWRELSAPLDAWAGRPVSLAWTAEVDDAVPDGCLTPQAVVGEARVVASAGAAAEGDGEGAEPRPDLWLIVIDALRADHLGYAGAAGTRTPVADALAGEALRFADARSPSSWTREAMFALGTGTYASVGDGGLRDLFGFTLAPRLDTVVERLSASGYRTVGLYANPVMAPPGGFERGFDVYAYIGGDADLPGRLDDELADRDPRRPTLVYLHLLSPHLPYCFHEGRTDAQLEAAGVAGPWPPCIDEAEDLRARSLSATERTRIAAYYRGEVEEADRVLGELLARADDVARERPGWVFVTSDHGEELWDHGGFEHGHTLHRELLHVPLLVRPPAGHAARAGGADVTAPVSLVDLGHTLAALGWLGAIERPGGRSLAPLLARAQAGDVIAAGADDALAGAFPPAVPPADRLRLAAGLLYGEPQAAWIRGHDKVVVPLAPDGDVRRYDRIADPLERYDAPADPDEAAALRARWEAHRRLAVLGTAVLELRWTAAPGRETDAPPSLDLDVPLDVVVAALDGGGPHSDTGPGAATLTRTVVPDAAAAVVNVTLQLATGESAPAAPARLQLVGLREAAGPLHAAPRTPGTRVHDLPTPWSTPLDTPLTILAGDAGEFTLTWRAAPSTSVAPPAIDPAVRDRVEALGYGG